MTELPTPDPVSLRNRPSALVLVLIFVGSFVASFGAVRNWTDVKVAAAIAAVLCLRGGWSRLVAAAAGLVAGHLILGAFASVGHWPISAWFIAGSCAVFDAAVLVKLLDSMTAESGTRLPSRRLLTFLAGAAALAVVSGITEAGLISLTDAETTASAMDIVFGLAVAACLAAIAVTRRGSEWFSSERLPGTELLAPLLVVLVTLAAIQVTRQVWDLRDDDRLDVVATSIGTATSSQWEREIEVLELEARAIAPAVAFDETAFVELVEPYVADNDIAVAAALIRRPLSGGPVTVIDSFGDTSLSNVSGSASIDIGDDVWRTSLDGSLASIDDGNVTLIMRSVELVALPDGGNLVVSVAYSLPALFERAVDDASGRFDDVAIGVDLRRDSQTTRIWTQDESATGGAGVLGGTLSLGEQELDVVVYPLAAFGSASGAMVLVLGVEVALGILLFGVLVLGANAQFKMTQERRRRENLLEAALDATPGISVVYDSEFRVLAANRPVREQFPGQIPGVDIWQVFGLDIESGRSRMVRDVLQAALNGAPAHIEIAEDHVDNPESSASNRMMIIEMSAYPVTSPGGEPVGFLHSVDATERRSLAMRSAQSERMESLGALAGGLAHDFNNLLFVTLGNLQLMAMNESITSDEKLSKFLSRSMSAVERGAEITRSLLAVARSQPLEESAVSLSDLVKGILPLVRQALGTGRRVEVDIPDPTLQLMVDPGRLSSCILNLAFNARDAMGPNGTLRISAHLDESSDMIELAVSDDGSGMPEDVVARAFEPFFTTKSAGSGTGLGLATVYAFAKQSGGTAFLESRIGVGTTVTLVLPRFSGIAPSEETVAARRSGRRVVVADDEQSLAEMVAAWLIDMGIDARFATSPKAALELIETFEPDVLVSDANFGEELDGIELARLGTAIVPDMAVVFMTGYSSSMRELQELGERTLAKPFSREDLYGAISPLIAEQPSSEPKRIKTSGEGRRRSRPR